MSQASDPFTRFEYDGWQRVAGRYEDAWSALTRAFIPHLLDATGVRAGERVLDVACGPGYVAGAARDRGASPRGVDFSPEMVRLARERYPEVRFSVGDAQLLDFDDELFDAVLINFGLLHLARPEAALEEARRVLRAGGRLGFTVWAGPEHSPGAKAIDDAVNAHADRNVTLPKGPDYFGFGQPDDCRAALERIGFDPSTFVFRTLLEEWEVPTASFVFEAERDAGVRTAALLRAQSDATLAAIRAGIEAGLAPFARDGRLRIPYGAHVVAATAGPSARRPVLRAPRS